MRKLFSKFWRGEADRELLESALLLGLIVVACLVVISTLGVKVVVQWHAITGSL